MVTIILISPPEKHVLMEAGDRPNLGILYLAGAIKTRYHNPIIIDLNHDSYNTLDKYIKLERPSYIGITTSTPYYNWIINFASHLKHRYPKIKLIAGGPHATVLPETLLPYFDFVVKGEGEKAIVDIIKKIVPEGIVKYPYEKNLDNLAFPSREILLMNRYGINQNGVRTATLLSSRSCPYNCFFCTKNILGPTTRYHSPERTIKELKQLIRMGFHSFYFLDDCFTVNRKRVIKLCKLIIKNKLKITYRIITRTDIVDRKLLTLMKESGLNYISFGIEHMNNEVLKKSEKNNTVENNIKAVELAKDLGLKIRASMIMNLPGATKETMYECLEFAKKYKIDYADFYLLQAYPGTRLWDNPEKFGCKINDRSFDYYQTSGRTNISIDSMKDDDVLETYRKINEEWRKFKRSEVPWEC